MEAIKKAIEMFRQKRLAVYKADQDQVVRDTRGAERATRDHTGRWLFELLQNSDDAGASEIRVLVEDNAIHVADNGRGLKPEAVSAICGTDFSDKNAGAIGRKGVGFKSVYEVSKNPQVLTVNGEGIEFSRDSAETWLRQNGFRDGYVPYQWIPFFVSWDEARRKDPLLDSLVDYKTVVRLPIVPHVQDQRIRQLFKEWPPHALFAFRHVRNIHAPGLDIVLAPTARDGIWSMSDSRRESPDMWRVARHTEHPSAELLEPLGKDEQKAISEDGVGFLIAAPLENDCVVPTTAYLPVHVFYPTEQKGPVRLLLHAEFLVKSDRTALMPMDGNPFNAWVADRLASYVCKFVNDSYRPEAPSSHAALLVPFGDRASHPVAEELWQRIADEAQGDLRLADVEARQRLTVDEARLISVSVRPDLARTLLEATSTRGRLLDPAFDSDKEAREALRELGCKGIHDQDLIAAIVENAESLAANTQWVWACWEWLAAWIAKKPYGEEHRRRIERARDLPIVPIDGSLVKAADLAGRIVTWKRDADVGNLPGWLPLTFVEDWFRDSIQAATDQEPCVKGLCGKLGIAEPVADVIQRAVGKAIEQYWKDRQGHPERFLRFILEQDWHETSRPSSAITRCPVPTVQEGEVRETAWSEAKRAHFGRKWGNDLLAELYEGNKSVAWAQGIGGDADKERGLLEWLGCSAFPRVIKDRGPRGNGFGASELPEECRAWRARDFGYTDRTPTVDTIGRLEGLAVRELSDSQVYALLVLLARHWVGYYKGHAQATLSWFYYTTRSRDVPAFWWYEVLHEVRPVTKTRSVVCPLADCWLPDKLTERAIGGLLSVIDLDAFGNDKDTVRKWLMSEVDLRTRIEQLTATDWTRLLSTSIPDKAPAERLTSDEPLRDKVTGWYGACLETVAEQENASQNVFASCPLLCRKADSWQYVADEPRYLNDDHELATAFAGDVWVFHVPTRLTADAEKYLGIRPLSKSVEVHVTPGEPKSPLSKEVLARFDESLPYVWAWRSSQSKQAAERLSARLKGLKVHVVPALKAELSLDGVHHEVERRWHVEGDTIRLQKDHANETELAQALAKALNVRSEADFYENLLRCHNSEQRKEKLLSKGIADAEVERCLREYSGRRSKEVHEESPDGPGAGEPEGGISQPPSPDGVEGTHGGPGPKPTDTRQGDKPHGPSGSNGTPEEPVRFKNANTVDYVLGRPPVGGAGTSAGGGGGGMGQQGHSLTHEVKAELEEAGRLLAERELKKMGFSVDKMPPENPGFDLRAKRNGVELRVEVKAHTGRATVVDVTQRQYKEYVGQQGYRWELWNVEHLAENDAEPVAITRYADIPDDALDARTFRVDLRKCQLAESRSADAQQDRLGTEM